jgi:hypothetical protein
MNESHIGDAKDFAKGGMFGILRGKNLIGEPAVVPLFTRPAPNPSQIQSYLAIMGIGPQRLLSIAIFPDALAAREAYFEAVVEAAVNVQTIFVDPDTGIGTNKRRDPQHILLGEILSLLTVDHDRILVVYDESFSNAKKEDKRRAMTDRLNQFRVRHCCCFYYYGSSVNLLFVGNKLSVPRLDLIQTLLTNLLVGTPDRIVV